MTTNRRMHQPTFTVAYLPTTGKVAESKSASMLLVMVGVRLAECSLRMHNPTDALDMANQLLASTSGAEYSTARHILHVVKALSSLELGLAFNAVIDAHNLIATAPEYRRQSSISFARHVAFKVVEHNTVQPEGCSTESCCSNARKRTRPAVSEATGTTCSHDDVQDTAATIKHTTKRCRAL